MEQGYRKEAAIMVNVPEYIGKGMSVNLYVPLWGGCCTAIRQCSEKFNDEKNAANYKKVVKEREIAIEGSNISRQLSSYLINFVPINVIVRDVTHNGVKCVYISFLIGLLNLEIH